MDKGRVLFERISKKLLKKKGVTAGCMAFSLRITYRKKTFMFYRKEEMIFLLVRGFDITLLNVKKYKYLSLFKNKPPMKAWFQVPFSESKQGGTLALRT